MPPRSGFADTAATPIESSSITGSASKVVEVVSGGQAAATTAIAAWKPHQQGDSLKVDPFACASCNTSPPTFEPVEKLQRRSEC
ncbi:MAG: hypothetical protein GY788_00205 [bacterium]|nr:hypothetical protein [bacterium]